MENELALRLENANLTRRRPAYGWQSINVEDKVAQLFEDMNLTEASYDTRRVFKNLAKIKEQNNKAYTDFKEVLKQFYAKDR